MWEGNKKSTQQKGTFIITFVVVTWHTSSVFIFLTLLTAGWSTKAEVPKKNHARNVEGGITRCSESTPLSRSGYHHATNCWVCGIWFVSRSECRQLFVAFTNIHWTRVVTSSFRWFSFCLLQNERCNEDEKNCNIWQEIYMLTPI